MSVVCDFHSNHGYSTSMLHSLIAFTTSTIDVQHICCCVKASFVQTRSHLSTRKVTLVSKLFNSLLYINVLRIMLIICVLRIVHNNRNNR